MADKNKIQLIRVRGNIPMEKQKPFIDSIENNLTASGTYYDGKYETIDYLEFIVEALVRNGIPASRAYDVVSALKYLSPRLGAKSGNPIELDLMKAENYIHRARTGKWLDKKFLDPFGGRE